jgi:RNA processing factor Prp31
VLEKQLTIPTLKNRAKLTVSTIDGRCKVANKEGNIDWSAFPEMDVVISTVKFFKKQKSFFNNLRQFLNKEKHFLKDAVSKETIMFNEWYAEMIMSEIKNIASKVENQTEFKPILAFYVQNEVNFFLPDLAKLFSQARNYTSGFFLKKIF